MLLQFEDLFPYTSVILARVRSGVTLTSLVEDILNDLENVLELNSPGSNRNLVQRGGPNSDQGVWFGFLHYGEGRSPGWTSSDDIADHINQLIVVCRRTRYVAIYISDSSRYRAIVNHFNGALLTGLSALVQIEQSILNAAFARGPTRTLWLTGVHARTSVKADSKILSGINLRDALDPLDDQTYYFSAARCGLQLPNKYVAIGVNPRKSRVWVGANRRWADFRDTVKTLLERIADFINEDEKDYTPIPVLAVPLEKSGDVNNAFDVNVIPPEVLSDQRAVDEETMNKAEKWYFRSSFEVIEIDGTDLVAEVTLDNTVLGRLRFEVDDDDPNRVIVVVSSIEESVVDEDLLSEAREVCDKSGWLQIRYETGHTLSGGALYSIRFRDVHFEKWYFEDLPGINVKREKPVDPDNPRRFLPERVGLDDSLFCWVWNHWPCLEGAQERTGWLACDDGSMEIADFIHLDDSSDQILLTLIHVKGSGSESQNRGVSVSDYEVVTGQAVKNLRWLDRLALASGLEEGIGSKISNVIWHDGEQDNREGMIDALREIGDNYKRRVVILQPRVTDTALADARADQRQSIESGQVARLRQLDTLLVGAGADCRDLGAELLVLSQAVPP